MVLIISHGKLVASDTTENLEKMTMGSNELNLTVKTTQDKLKNILSSISGIEEISFLASEEDSAVDIKIKTSEKNRYQRRFVL